MFRKGLSTLLLPTWQCYDFMVIPNLPHLHLASTTGLSPLNRSRLNCLRSIHVARDRLPGTVMSLMVLQRLYDKVIYHPFMG